MTDHTKRSGAAVIVALVVAVAVHAGPAGAETPNTCVAGKIKCTTAFAGAVFKCFAAAYKKPPTFEGSEKAKVCVRKAREKLGTAVSSKPGCIEKVVAKQDPSKPETVCPTSIDEYALDEMVKDFTEGTQDEIAPFGISPVGSTCDAGKFKCVASYFKVMLGCHEKAAKKGVGVDDTCMNKAFMKFGAGDYLASNGCFAKVEAKQKLGKLKSLCASDSNSDVCSWDTYSFVQDVVGEITH